MRVRNRLAPKTNVCHLRGGLYLALGLLLVRPIQIQAQERGTPATAPARISVTLADRAADGAVQQLIESALAFELRPGLTVESIIVGSVERELGVRQWIVKSHRLGLTRRHDDGTVEVDAVIDMPALIEELGHVVGREIPRNASWPPILSATGQCNPSAGPFVDTPGWRHCTKREGAMVACAAAAGARAKLLRQLRHVRIGGRTPLGQLFDQHPDFRQKVAGAINQLTVEGPFFDRVGICRCEVSLTRSVLLGLLSRASVAHGVRLGTTDMIVLPGDESSLRAGAWAVSPLSTASPDVTDRPAWARTFRTIRATARVPADTGDRDDRRNLAVKAARIEACRLLWLEIEALPLPGDTTVGQRLRQDRAIRRALAEVDSLMFPLAPPTYNENDNATVAMGIQLDQVWRLLTPHLANDK